MTQMNSEHLIGVIADDFTGAADSGVQFARYGLETLFGISTLPDSQVVILNTASREMDPVQARTRCAEAVQRLHGRLLFKKIDSTLRGHLSAELEGLQSVMPDHKLVVCPAAPNQGRVVRDGMVYINDVLLHESAFKNDPVFPARTASIVERMGIPATHLSLQTIRGPLEELFRAILSAPHAVIIVDAVDQADLARVSQAVVQAKAIPCGALGFANAWAQALTGRRPSDQPFICPSEKDPLLIVAGSANARSHAQIEALGRHRDSLVCKLQMPIHADEEQNLYKTIDTAWQTARAVILCPGVQETIRSAEWLSFGQTVSRLAAELIRRRRPAGLVIAGGETANHLCDLLRIQAVRLEGEAAPGFPFGRFIGGAADGLTVVTKAGGFGEVNAFEKIIYG